MVSHTKIRSPGTFGRGVFKLPPGNLRFYTFRWNSRFKLTSKNGPPGHRPHKVSDFVPLQTFPQSHILYLTGLRLKTATLLSIFELSPRLIFRMLRFVSCTMSRYHYTIDVDCRSSKPLTESC